MKTKAAMESAFPDADIKNYEDLIDGLSLPDAEDRHVLAAAIRGKADVIITCNTKDFPSKIMAKFDLEAQHPDEFILNLISLDKIKCQQALATQVKSLKNPPRSKEEVLNTLEKLRIGKKC